MKSREPTMEIVQANCDVIAVVTNLDRALSMFLQQALLLTHCVRVSPTALPVVSQNFIIQTNVGPSVIIINGSLT